MQVSSEYMRGIESTLTKAEGDAALAWSALNTVNENAARPADMTEIDVRTLDAALDCIREVYEGIHAAVLAIADAGVNGDES